VSLLRGNGNGIVAEEREQVLHHDYHSGLSSWSGL
jgi:hypothetical protein